MQATVWNKAREKSFAQCECWQYATFCASAREIISQMLRADPQYFNVLMAQLRAHRHGEVVVTDDDGEY